MKPYKIILTLLFLFSLRMAFSQEMRLIRGTMKDSSGEPLIGVSINIKGTTTGVVTDINGTYSINAPLGSTLVFSYIGFSTKEMLVTVKNSEPGGQSQNITSGEPQPERSYVPVSYPEYTDTLPAEEGRAVFTSSTPSFSVINPDYNWLHDHDMVVNKIGSIDFGKDLARINMVRDEYIRIPHVSYFTSVSTEHHTRLPKLQSSFAQGRPVNGTSQWQSPETGEILSWGPNLQNFEFDGSSWDYDSNGRLVPKNTGNGNPARSYDPSKAFCNGFTYINSLKIFLKTERKEYSIALSNQLNKGILAGQKSNGNIVDLKLKRVYGRFKIGGQLTIDNLKSNYLDGSPNSTLVIASILTSPPSFDITGGKKARDAYNSSETYQLENGTQRSYAAGKVNHPYWLLHNMQDKENQQSINSVLNLEYKLSGQFSVFTDFRYQNQKNKVYTGFLSVPVGMDETANTFRNGSLESFLSATGINLNKYFRYADLSSSLRYEYYSVNSELARRDEVLSDEILTKTNYSLSREEHSINWNSNLTFRKGILLKMTHNFSGNNHYHGNKMLYAPTYALGFNIDDIFRIHGFVERIKLKANWGYNYSFAAMNSSFGKYNFQNIRSSDFYNTLFEHEIIPNLGLTPEKVEKKDAGGEFGFLNNKISLDIDFYEHKTTNAMFPVLENGEVLVKNLASTRTRGIEAEILIYQNFVYNNRSSQFRFIFDSYKSVVTNIYGNNREIPLGGYADVHTSLIKGYPAGVVVGTSWRRDDNGKLIIGEDGYPLVDDNLKVIANPQPDFTIGFEPTIFLGSFTTSILMEYRHGGQVWNGTGNVLSYLGLSEKTVEGRKVLEYIFPGVKEDGTVNTTPVDFANPTRSLQQNRWYRYGMTGVAEDAVENASWFRIREISVSYKFYRMRDFKPEISVFIRNPLLITSYSGSDPNITLWKKSNTGGLDLFNMPAVSSVGISIKVSL